MQDQRYCTNCGQKTEQHAENLFVCPERHENWVNLIPGSACFIIKDDKVLYGIRSIEPNAGGLDVPGGFLDLGETLEQGAVREAKEEIGVDIRLVDFLGTYLSDYTGRPILTLVYVAEIIGGEIRPGDDLNGGDPVWCSMDNLPQESEFAWAWIGEAQADLVKWYNEHKR